MAAQSIIPLPLLNRAREIFLVQALAGMDVLEAVERRGSFSSHLYGLYGSAG